ncbi:MAG: RNA polymerase sigma factor [Calditrichaeota bacterium]|nr:MAG: RNA polymerase sigma factor [Calditrichota bacterium]
MIVRFLEQIEKLSGKLYLFVLKLVRDHEDALDIVQDTFMRIFQMIKKEQKEISDGYFFKTAYNLSINQLNKAKRKLDDGTYEIETVNEEPLEHLLLSEKRKQIENALFRLSGKQKEVVVYRFFTGCTINEIAGMMSISTASVKVHLARGLVNLKKMIPEEERL